MKANSVEYKNLYGYNSPTHTQQDIVYKKPAFEGAKSRKSLKMIEQTKNLKKVKATFQDMVDAYEEHGYNTTFKRDSHATVHIQEDLNISLGIPHKDKYVKSYDLKRLQLIAEKKFQETKLLH